MHKFMQLHRIGLCALLLLIPAAAQAQYKMTTQEYIDTYKELAIRSMEEYGIPASITLAQGLLESGNGGSRLAVEGNNHFGIKWKSNWTGGRIYHDDDAKGECFRKYRNAEQSYHDHSKFLTESPRYADLFKLDTNPRYPQLLIDLIEKNRLYQFDREKSRGGILARRTERKEARAELNEPLPEKHTIERNNGVRYIVTLEGESFASIAAQYNLSVKRLLKYNDLRNSFPLPAGTALYIEPKRNRSSSAAMHTIENGESYHSVSQKYGIKLKRLQKMNPVTRQSVPRVGQQLRLR